MAKYEDATRLPNGLAQFTVAVVGTTAGAHACLFADVGDRIVAVQQVTKDASAQITAVADVTEEFVSVVATAEQIDNTGGTDLSGSELWVTLAKGRDNQR